MIIVTGRFYQKSTDISYIEKTVCFENSKELKDYIANAGNFIIDKVFEIKEEEENNGQENA